MEGARPVVHFHLPYGSVALEPGVALERAYDELALIAALQGLVNRAGPRLYLRGVAGQGEPDLDGFWWESPMPARPTPLGMKSGARERMTAATGGW